MSEPSEQAPDLDKPTDVSVGPAEVAAEHRSETDSATDHEQTIDTPDELGGTEGEGGAG